MEISLNIRETRELKEKKFLVKEDKWLTVEDEDGYYVAEIPSEEVILHLNAEDDDYEDSDEDDE